MPLKTKRWNDPRAADDGFRLLVCRYRPRAVPKSEETWDAWWPQLGPSPELHAAFWGKHGPALTFEAYAPRYLAEMRAQKDRVRELAERVAAGETLTLLCSSACVDAKRCHRVLLAKLIHQALPARPPVRY